MKAEKCVISPVCLRCHKVHRAGDVYVDLYGELSVDFYCVGCVLPAARDRGMQLILCGGETTYGKSVL